MDLLEEAIKFHKDGFLEKAENIYQKIIKNEPKNFQAKHLVSLEKNYLIMLIFIIKTIF